MKVAFDLYGAEPAKNGVMNHGGGEYIKTVFDYFYNHKNQDVNLSVIVTGNDENILRFLDRYSVNIYKCPDGKSFQKVLNEEVFDTLYCGLYVDQYNNVNIPKTTRFIITEHGLRGIEVKFDKYFLKTEKKKKMNLIKMMYSKIFPKSYLKYKIKKYSPEFKIKDDMQVVTVSNHSKYSIQYYYPKVKDILVAYSPMKLINGTLDEDKLSKIGVEKGKYILMINSNRGEKNCLRALIAINELASKSMIPNDIKVVMTGVTYNKPFRKYRNIQVIKLGYVDSVLLETLYANAHLFLYPTINEGFGYPPLEAMKYGTLVATSAICSVPEVCGDSVLYFNPYDIKEIENRILQSFDLEIRNRYISNIKDRLNYISNEQESGLDKLTRLIIGE